MIVPIAQLWNFFKRIIPKTSIGKSTTGRNIQETRNTHYGIPKSADINDTDSIKDLSAFGIRTSMCP